MPNYAGISAVLSATLRPGLIVPHLTIPSIASLSWRAAKSHGVNYVIFDKDNCLTKPHVDALEGDITQSYHECLDVFGRDNVLIVSNSAGSSSDIGGVGAQHLSRVLFGTPVLCHPAKKPAVACAKQVVDYFGSARGEEEAPLRRLFAAKPVQGSEGHVQSHLTKTHMGDVLVIGDRIATDTVLSHRISDLLAKRYPTQSARAIAVLTTSLWANEGVLNTLMRRAEASIRTRLVKRGVRPGGGWQRDHSAMEDLSGMLVTSSSSTTSATTPALPRQPQAPTITSLLVSSLYSTRLPPILKHTLSLLLTNRLTRATLTFLKDGWLLILRGTREGLNRPEYVFGRSSSPRSRTSPFNSRQQHRSYSTGPTPRKIPLINWLAAFAAIAIIPFGYLAGDELHRLIKSGKEERVAKEVAALKVAESKKEAGDAARLSSADREHIIRVKNQVARELDEVSSRIEAIKQRRREQALEAKAARA